MTTALRKIEGLKPESLRGIVPAPISSELPTFEWVDPRTLFVEDGYQREIGENGVALCRKIFAGFDWTRFKVPICVRLPDGSLVCIDGQHTATSAASHPGLPQIPVMIVPAADAKLRSAAFVGHNRDRVQLTPQAIYRAELASDEPLASGVERACRAAGAHVLDKPVNLREPQAVGATIAIGTMKAVVKRQGEGALTRVLRVLVAAKRGPIKAAEIAAASIIFAKAGGVSNLDERLRAVIASKSTEAWAAIGGVTAAESREPLASAVATAWCQALDIRLGHAGGKGGIRGAKHAVPRTIPPKPARPAAQPIAHKPKPAPAPILAAKPAQAVQRAPAPKATPAPQPALVLRPAPPVATPSPSKAAESPPPSVGEVIRAMGVEIRPATQEVRHRGLSVRLGHDALILVTALARVMPSLADPGRLEAKVFEGHRSALDSVRLKLLIEETNPALRGARLEIKTVAKIGHSLFDLGAGDN